MLEKAFAKYFDAYPDLRSSKAKKLDSTGYAGLRGIRPYIVLVSTFVDEHLTI